MRKKIKVNNTYIEYDLQYKRVKNINLRIRSDGNITVSADRRIPQEIIDEFIKSKGDFILKAINKIKENADKPKKCYYTEEEVKKVIIEICERVYPYYGAKKIKYPNIKFKKMVSRWGSCHPQKGILTFNTNLMYACYECIEYVVYHEFTHFLQANHSSEFYDELEIVCPDWKKCREKLKEINIR